MRALISLAAILIWGIGTHVALYGWRAAPVSRVHLTRSQWLLMAVILLPPAATAIALFAFRRALLRQVDADVLGTVLLTCVLALVASVWGMAPSHRETGSDEGTA